MKKKIKDLTLNDCVNICKNHCAKYKECNTQCVLRSFCISIGCDLTDIKEFKDYIEVEIDE